MSSKIKAVLPSHLRADDVGLAGLLGAAAALVDDGQVPAQPAHVGQRPLDAPLVRADHHQVVLGEVPGVLKWSSITGAA